MLLLVAMQLSLAPDNDLGTHGDMRRDTRREGGVTDMVTLTTGAGDTPFVPGHWDVIRESSNISESFSVQVTFGVG